MEDDIGAQVQVINEGLDVQEIPAQVCTATTHIGPYEELIVLSVIGL